MLLKGDKGDRNCRNVMALRYREQETLRSNSREGWKRQRRALTVRNRGGLLHRQRLLLRGDAAFPACIFLFHNAVLSNPAVTRGEEKGIERFGINTALLFVITCWYF